MTISQLIAQLSDIMAKNGDLEVRAGYTVCDEDDESNGYAPLRHISINNTIGNECVALWTDIIVDDYDEDEDY